jgi:hypothetical protein
MTLRDLILTDVVWLKQYEKADLVSEKNNPLIKFAQQCLKQNPFQSTFLLKSIK